MLERWTQVVIRNRFAVIVVWLALVMVGSFAGSKLNDHLTTSLSVPGSESAKAGEILSHHFKENIEGTFTVLLKVRTASPGDIDGYKAKIAVAASAIPTAEVAQQRVLEGVLFASIGTSFKLIDAAAYTEKFRKALIDQGLKGALVTGPPAIYRDVTPVLTSDLQRGQMLAVLLALLLLILMLGTCWAAVVPLVFAMAAISLALAAVYLLAQRFLMVLYIPNIVELIGLGLAIDYSLLIVHRFRREVMDHDGIRIDDAIAKTMQTAGRTVILSGISVSIGLATLLFVPVPFVRSLGMAGLVVPVVSVITALTLQPALLSFLGRRGVTPRGFPGLMTRSDLMTGLWAKIANTVIRKPIAVLSLSVAALAVAASSIFWLQITPSSLTAIPAQLESARALSMTTERVGPGIITPNEIVIDLGKPHQATTLAVKKARTNLANAILRNPEVFVVATDEVAPFVDLTGRYLRIFVLGHHDLGAEASQKLVHELREKYLPEASFSENTKIYLGGAPAQGVDLLERILKSFPWIVLFALGIAYIVLLRAFRSLVLPLKAILLDLVSISVAYGSVVLVFRFGLGSSILGTYKLDQIEAWALIFLFPVLFGLSMDYEIFIVSRIREAWNRGSTNTEAIVEGLAHTGGVVTAAAIILVGAIGGLVIGHFAGLQQLGVGLAFGVLIDATIIRGLLLPSAMVLLGRWNWWLPNSVAKLVRVKTSPLETREVRF